MEEKASDPVHSEAEKNNCTRLAEVIYDTAIPPEKFHLTLITNRANQLAGATSSSDCELLLGIPAYDDAGVGYHHTQVENISSALQGISASPRKNSINGIAIYCEWEMNENKWQIWRKFIR